MLFKAVVLGPPGTVYEGGVWHFDITLSPSYPMTAPKFKGHTKLYHPMVENLDENMIHTMSDCTTCGLQARWSPALTITKALDMLRQAMIIPNLDYLECCSPEIYKTIKVSKD